MPLNVLFSLSALQGSSVHCSAACVPYSAQLTSGRFCLPFAFMRLGKLLRRPRVFIISRRSAVVLVPAVPGTKGLWLHLESRRAKHGGQRDGVLIFKHHVLLIGMHSLPGLMMSYNAR